MCNRTTLVGVGPLGEPSFAVAVSYFSQNLAFSIAPIFSVFRVFNQDLKQQSCLSEQRSNNEWMTDEALAEKSFIENDNNCECRNVQAPNVAVHPCRTGNGNLTNEIGSIILSLFARSRFYAFVIKHDSPYQSKINQQCCPLRTLWSLKVALHGGFMSPSKG